MNVLLINPPALHTIPEFPDDRGKSYLETEDFGCFPPLGLLYVLAYAEKHAPGHCFSFIDCIAEHISYESLETRIKEIKPDLVGITSFTIALIDVCKTAEIVRTVSPQTHICMGGHHPIAFPLEAAQLNQFDSVIVGEGEVPFAQLIHALSTHKPVEPIVGLYTAQSIQVWRDTSSGDKRFLPSVVVPPSYVDDLDTLPFPARSYIKHINYQSIVGVSNKLATIITSRGCPYQCTFCDVPYKRYRSRSIAGVLDEVEACLALGYKEFHFYDDLFNITPEKVIEFCDGIKQRGLQFPWNFRGRINTATFESLKMAKETGCRLISFGVETGTDEGLKTLRKGITLSRIKEVFRWCRQLHIKTLADFMIGLPDETSIKDVENNFDFLISLNPDYAQIAIMCIYPNTVIHQQAVEKGLIDPDKWINFARHPYPAFTIDHWEEHLKTGQLVEMQKKGYKKYYLRPGYILQSILNTGSIYEFAAKVKGLIKLVM